MKYFSLFLISQIVNSCNYVSNFKYGEHSYNGAIYELDSCHSEINWVNGVFYYSRKFYCDSEGGTVYVDEYTNDNCSAEAAFSTMVQPIEYDPATGNRGQYSYRCDSVSECTSKVIAELSKKSIESLGKLDFENTCLPEYANDEFDTLQILTNVCVDASYGDQLTQPDRSTIVKCNSSGLFMSQYTGSKSCEGYPEHVIWLKTEGCSDNIDPIFPEVALYTRVTYCDGENIGPAIAPTLSPTLAPTKKSSASPAFISFFLYFNTVLVLLKL